MRILEAAEGAKSTGAAAAALTSARALAARGHRVTWLCESGSTLADDGRRAGFAVSEELSPSPAGVFASAGAIRAACADVDLIHVHRSRSHLAALLAAGFSRRTRPVVRTCHAARPGETGLFARWLLARSDGLVVRSAALAFDLAPPSDPRSAAMTIVPGGVDGGVFHPGLDGSPVRSQLGIDGRTVVGTVAHLKPGRRLFEFCRAAERLCADRALEALHFLIVGRGRLRKSLNPWIDKAGLGGRITVFDPGEAFPQALAALDIGVLLVPGSDGSARTALEMAALGKPLVLGNVGALVDLAGPESESALLVPPESPEQLAAAIRELALDADRRARLGAAVRSRFEERHTLERLGANYEKFLEQVLSSAAGGER
jgi:glycosyltransferase involved in cell wall biosynthesis